MRHILLSYTSQRHVFVSLPGFFTLLLGNFKRSKFYMFQIGCDTDCLSFDLRPSDAINIAVRCKVTSNFSCFVVTLVKCLFK